MATVYGSLALALVSSGLWALLAQDVTRRLREFGVRLSLGASPAMLRRAVTARAIRLTAAGTTLGLVVAWMLARALTDAVSINGRTSPWIVAGVVGLLLLIALSAAMGPARRAAQTEPMAALRSE
jgi:putative ABC transport system permease protein